MINFLPLFLVAAWASEFVLEDLDVLDGLEDDIQMRQVPGLLQIRRQEGPELLHVGLAQVGVVEVLLLAHNQHIHLVV